MHAIQASDQPVQDGAQTMKSHSIQKEETRIVCVIRSRTKKKQTKEGQNQPKEENYGEGCRRMTLNVSK